uniref:Uncharacterized protein n=1 Tax=Amphimedon queenslandica TaxID=400682 RepID=A0A1X7TC16_AMPQE
MASLLRVRAPSIFITSTQIQILWELPPLFRPTERRPAEISQYVLNYRANGKDTPAVSFSNNSLKHTIEPLVPNTEYIININVEYSEPQNLKGNPVSITAKTKPADNLPEVSTNLSSSNINDMTNPSIQVKWEPLSPNDGSEFLQRYIVRVTVTDLAASRGSRRRRQANPVMTTLEYNVSNAESQFDFTDIKPFMSYSIGVNAALLVDGLEREVPITRPTSVDSPESIPGVISDLMHARTPTRITISWNPPTIPNGIITVYEIRYRESTSTGPYTITNTTNTQYSIAGLIPNTSYTIGVRAYTSIGPGEWTDREYTTIEIPVIQTFFITKLNSTAVRAEWGFVYRASHFTVYYESTSSSSRKKRQVETGMRVFPVPGVISDLMHARTPTRITISWNPPTIPNGIITVYEIRYRESTSTGPYNITNTTNTYYSIVGLIPNTSYTIGVRAYTSIGPGEWTQKEFNTAQIYNDIVMECSPAYATTEFKTKSTVEPVYDTTNDEYETSLPPPSTEYEIPTLLLLLQLKSVHLSGQEPPSNILPSNGVQLYLPYQDRIIPDYSMMYTSQFYDYDYNNDVNDIIDTLWCQSANNVTNIGVWYYPNGTEVPLFDGDFDDSSAPNPVYSKRFSGQIALARRDYLSGYEGLYKCIIPDENGVNQTLVVGAYTDTGYNNNDGPDADPTMQFSLLSTSRLATPPVFSLSFNVSDGPPTTVSCSVNGNGISTELSRVIVNGSGSVTRVTVTNLTEAGNYQCTVSNARVTNGPIKGSVGSQVVISTSSLSISVSDTPTSLTATRLSTGLAHVRLSWSTVSGATGYEVYSKFLTFTPVSAGTTASTTFNITSSLIRGITYTFYVVSYGSASLPSGNASVMLTFSNPIVNDLMGTVITIFAITLTWSPPTAIVPISYNINSRCRRVCESSVASNSETSVSSPHTSTGIPPYSQCGFDLIGVYGVELALLTTNYLATTLSTAPAAPVDDIIFSSAESVSMTVSWDEVPCNGRNGPITGYYLTHTNITSNTSYTVNITGGDNRIYNLTGLIPYTNYTVSIIPYNYNMTGPARQEIQLTAESIPGLISDLRHAKPPTAIAIVWKPPTIPNGIITVYEIRYRESTSTGPYNITNTTNTYYSIAGLIPNTSYTIGVRAYTSIGPGEWTNREYTTIEIPVIQTFFITKLNSTAVRAEWGFVYRASHFTVYYESTSSSSRKKRQVETGMRVFPGDTTEGLIGGLDPNLNYLFSISISFNVNGIFYEGERTQPIPADISVTETVTMSTSSSSVSLSSAHVCATVTTTVNEGNITVWIGVTVLASLLAVSIIVILILVMYIKRTNINQKRKLDNDIVMECSPAYATTEFKTNTTDDASVKDGPTYDTVQQSEQTQSTVEPVYDTANDEYETSLPPPSTEYEIPTV